MSSCEGFSMTERFDLGCLCGSTVTYYKVKVRGGGELKEFMFSRLIMYIRVFL